MSFENACPHIQLHAPVHLVPPCAVPWCECPRSVRHDSNGSDLCDYHLNHPATEDTNRTSIVDKFWRRVKKGPGCWLWEGAEVDEYGIIVIGKNWAGNTRQTAAHKAAWYLATGEWVLRPSVLRHLCHAPACVRVGHLTVGTALENASDTYLKAADIGDYFRTLRRFWEAAA